MSLVLETSLKQNPPRCNMFYKLWRLIKKYYFKLIRANDTPHAIALGFAFGMFFGTAIPLGQAVLAVLFAFIFRANKIVAFAVTWVSNPYTTPFMYLFFCYIGSNYIKFIILVHLFFLRINKYHHRFVLL